MKQRPVALALLSILLILSVSFSGRAASPGRCVVLIVNYLTLDDLKAGKTPLLTRATARMGLGLLNLKTNGGYNPEKIMLGLSAGAPVQAGIDGDPFLDAREAYNRVPARELYTRFFGRSPKGLIMDPFYASLINQNIANAEFVNEIGYIGTSLHRRGRKTGFWGGADPEPDLPNRAAALIAADNRGEIDLGGVGDVVRIKDPRSPSGRRLDGRKLWSSFVSQADRADLAVIDWGDLGAIEYWAPYLTVSRYQSLRSDSIVRFDRFFLDLFNYCAANRRLLVVLSCATPRDPLDQEHLGWVMVADPKQSGHGFLTSATTRISGMVSPYDIHLLIDSALGIPAPASSIGAPVHIQPGRLPSLVEFNQNLNNLEFQRSSIVPVLIYLFAALLAFGVITVLYLLPPARFVPWTESVLLGTALLPASFLLTALFRFNSVPLHLAAGFFIVLLLLAVVRKSAGSIMGCLEAASLITVGVLFVDAFSGGFFSRWSVLGYSAASGARYYGLGNELTGIMAGAAILAAGLHYQRSRSKPAAWIRIGLLLAVIPIAVGFPRFGANFGDIIPMIPVLGYTFFAIGGRQPSLRILGIVLLLFLAVFSAFAWFDLHGSNPTHFGRLFREIQSSGPRVVGLMIQRKVEVNLKLIQFSRWTILVVMMLFIWPLTILHAHGKLRRALALRPALHFAFIGIVLEAVGGFIFNDSGIITAATTLIIPTFALLLLISDLRPENEA